MADKGTHKSREELLSSFDSLSRDEKIELIASLMLSLKEKASRDSVPVSIFDNDKLSILEALVKYMKENLKMRFVLIGSMLKRSDKTIWTTYQKSRQKMPMPFSSSVSDINIPTEKFSNRKFTTFEILVDHLKSINLTNHEIGVRLHRDDRTIWSVYDRTKKKKNG
ncbi:hypothetical protein HYU09_02520 [Candidatus Woesearchaeota archaeon]|nr:hypothetical protein [Candidatus Woesearchaeota archaeon]